MPAMMPKQRNAINGRQRSAAVASDRSPAAVTIRPGRLTMGLRTGRPVVTTPSALQVAAYRLQAEHPDKTYGRMQMVGLISDAKSFGRLVGRYCEITGTPHPRPQGGPGVAAPVRFHPDHEVSLIKLDLSDLPKTSDAARIEAVAAKVRAAIDASTRGTPKRYAPGLTAPAASDVTRAMLVQHQARAPQLPLTVDEYREVQSRHHKADAARIERQRVRAGAKPWLVLRNTIRDAGKGMGVGA